MNDLSQFKTPLKIVRGLGAAHSGTGHFIAQRLTGLASLPLIIFLIAFVICNLKATRSELMANLHHPLVAILLALSFTSIIWHMRLGLQVVIEDYVHRSCTKTALLVLNIFFTAALLVTVLFAILKLSLGL